ncbi:hypothetical protein ABEB36_014933 [Hypothenemus hampei]|uniref:Disintegrin and metalloproteinase domain-containing protein 12 n=1 Tax=Hypothenemus hampei TaxID=57062 RepID=A0ABD1E3D9_HYPHA
MTVCYINYVPKMLHYKAVKVRNLDILVNLFVNFLFFSDQLHPASDFSRHTLIKPKIFHGREKRQISDTKNENGQHVNYLQIVLETDDGTDVILDLTINKQLISKGFFQKQQQDGQYIVHKPTINEINHCHYNGKIRGKPDSWAAISTCDGVSGVFFDGTEMHYVEKDPKFLETHAEDKHYLYKHSDLTDQNKTCGYAGDAIDPDHKMTDDNRLFRFKRSTDDTVTIRGPYNADKDSKYVELVLVVDNREFKELGENERRVIDHCKNIANIINGLYSPLNIFIALVGVVIWSEHDEITFSTDGDATLTSFLHYRKEKLILEHPNDNAQLLTKFGFDQGVVGKALKGPICTYEYSGGVNNDHSPVVGLVATTIAHEMGHNFGMEHDTVDCKCPDERCIMAPSSSAVAPTHWSSCSLNFLLLAFTHGMDYCLKNKPESLFDSPVCGNGFLEPGEQCDCGLPEHCVNPCCNASTCSLFNNASCATGECCDLNTCKPKNAGTMCRSADYECDLPEYCTGHSEFCPPDIFKMDTEECDDGKAFCYHGFCRTRTDQCKLLWGETGTSSDDQCYNMNTKGNRHGNCGYNKFNQSFTKCANESVLCGMLHCKHLNERLEFGMESVAILSHSFINKKGSIIPCRTAIVDLGTNQIDPGLTPDGAKCGDGKMCVNQQCMEVLSLRKQTPSCDNDCNGNGWCNSKGHCHCKDGFAPPSCEYPGPGGSEDSGPASDPNAHRGIVTALFIIFLGVVPMLAIVAILMFYAKYNLKLCWQKSPSTTSKSPGKSRGPPFPSDSLTKRNEANHSLLHEDSPPPSSGLENGFIGNFKGFSITPIKKEAEPIRAAPPAPPPPARNIGDSGNISNYQKPPPPVPKVPISNLLTKPVQKMNSFKKSAFMNVMKSTNTAATAPVTPANVVRPVISSPVLESSTSNAKELMSPLRNAPKVPLRPAPTVPQANNDRPLSNSEVPAVVSSEPKKETTSIIGSGTINRIASFLKPPDKKMTNNTLPKPTQVKAQKVLDKEILRTLKISDPVPQTEINIAAIPVDAAAKKAVVMRAQSMRTTLKPKERPNIQTFGSMRQPAGYKRPLSIPHCVRPKSPPPPAPINAKSIDRLDSSKTNQYDDCLNETVAPLASLSEENSPISDNIYAVIDENPSPEKGKSRDDGLGLLGEIVSEIQNRNFDSIYSTSTLNRKKKESGEQIDNCSEYVNTIPTYRENEYSNMNSNLKSNASTTSSSSYILPSAINVPVKEKGKNEVKPLLSSFRKDASTKPFSNSSAVHFIENKKSPTNTSSSIMKTTLKNSTVTPSNNLRTRKPSPTRPLSQSSHRSITNSPDLVTSCNTTTTTTKTPDVLNNSDGGSNSNSVTKKPSLTTKPTINSQKPVLRTGNTGRSVSFKSPQDKKDVKPPVAAKIVKTNISDVNNKTASSGVNKAARSNSNVASLQQKFEIKNSNVNKSKS